MDVERPLFARVSGVDVTGEPLQIEASGLEARVLQHEIDHLDGVLMLDRTARDQRKAALRALREGGSYSPTAEEPADEEPGARRDELRVAYLGTSEFAVAVLRRLADSPHRPALVVTPPDRPRGRGRRLAPPPAAAAASELGIELLQTESVNRPDAVEADPGARARTWASSALSGSSSATRCSPSWSC